MGQVTSYSRATNEFEVALLNGGQASFDAKNVATPKDFKKPGHGGDESSFDVLMGPNTPSDNLAEEMSDSIFEKGFCVVKICQSVKDLETTIEAVRSMGDEGRLGRLPEEVEEGYLGTGGKGKVFWLDPDQPGRLQDPLLDANDLNMSYLASIFQAYSPDAIGKVVDERTPALVSLSLGDDEEEDYPHPMANDKTLGDYMGTWKRGLLRVVHFMGPAVATVTLESKDGPAATALPCQQESIEISAPPNTIVLFRTDCYTHSIKAPDEVLTMMVSYLAQGPQFQITGWEGDIRALTEAGEGPPPPPGDAINVLDTATRLGRSWDTAAMYNTGLQGGTDAVVEIPLARFDINMYFCPDPDELLMGPPRSIQRHCSFVDGVDIFDNKYFEISNNESQGMGPLQRMVLEVGGSLCYSQGLTKKAANRQSHHAGCSVGLDKDDFPSMGLDTGSSAGGNALAIIANRFSFVFNMKGPNFICDTACSASLTATHTAKLMLYERTFDPLEFHIAVGTHLTLSIGPWIGCSMSNMVSPQGRCFTFNSSANGYLRGEGTSGMYLKYGAGVDEREAIFRSSQIGQDGRSASLTAPNGPAQEEMIARAVKEARMTPPESTVWECHGTGTSLGDPIEVGAVRKIQIKVARPEPLMLSTSKANIGHLEGGAAMAGMIKCVQQIMTTAGVSSLHCKQLNPHLEHAAFEAFFCTELSPFKYSQGHCQVTSLGFGGSNGHAIFWGKKNGLDADPMALLQKRIAKMAPPEVRVVGDNPDEWETDGPNQDPTPGIKYKIEINSFDPVDAPQKWVRDTAGDELEEDDDEDVFYSITGNFNSWEEDRLAPGNVPGQHTTNVTVPDSGTVEFRFLKDGDVDKVVAPATPHCTKKTAPISGPEKGLTNSWVVRAPADSELQIELMRVKGSYSIVWFKAIDA